MSTRDAEKYVDGEDEVIDFETITNEVAPAKEQMARHNERSETKQWQLGHITRLRTAGMEDVSPKANKLLAEYKKDNWLEVNIEDKEYNQIKRTLKIVMDDLQRSVNKYTNLQSTTNLLLLKTKHKQASEYYDIYKYQSIKSGITNGSTTKQPSN